MALWLPLYQPYPKIARFATQETGQGTNRGAFPRTERMNMTGFASTASLSSAALSALILLGSAPSSAETFKSEYVVSIFGLSVAKSNFTTSVDGSRYFVSGGLRSAGLAEFFDEVDASDASARICSDRRNMTPSKVRLNVNISLDEQDGFVQPNDQFVCANCSWSSRNRGARLC